jgi:putative transcriptional regulator
MRNSIRDRRKRLGLTQEDLAEAAGVTRQTINAIENRRYNPTLALAIRLSRLLNASVEELFSPEE